MKNETPSVNANQPTFLLHNGFIKVGLAFLVILIEQLITSNLIFRANLPTFIFAVGLCLFFVMLLIVFIIKHNRLFHDQKSHNVKDIIINIIVNLCKIFVLTVIVNGVSVIMMKYFHLQDPTPANQSNLDAVSHFNIYGYLFILVLSVVIAPITEEFVFRYIPVLGTKPGKQRKIWLFIFGCLFVLAHLLADFMAVNIFTPHGLYTVVSHAAIYAVSAYVLASTYSRSDNMITNIGVHSSWNLLATLI